MTRPHVIVHSMASADGRTDHFAGDVGLYYELAAGFPHEAVLTGSGTLVAAAESQGVSLDGEDPLPAAVNPATGTGPAATAGDADSMAQVDATTGDDRRPLLIVVDARGRLTRFAWLRDMPYWRDVVVLCAESTPAGHLAMLARHRVGFLVVGAERVDLAEALAAIAKEYGVQRVRVDSGGTLNGALLRAGLVDEISILLGPYAVGGRSARGIFVADDLAPVVSDGPVVSGGPAVPGGVTPLRLSGVKRVRGDVVWLRYLVEPRTSDTNGAR